MNEKKEAQKLKNLKTTNLNHHEAQQTLQKEKIKMKRINTAEKDWQKKMEECMRKKEAFILVTKDEKLARSLEEGKLNVGTLKLILFGLSATGVAGLGGSALVAGLTSSAAFADPEPLSKSILAILAVICFAIGAHYVYRLVKMLTYKEYIFKVRYEPSLIPGGCFEIEGKPRNKLN